MNTYSDFPYVEVASRYTEVIAFVYNHKVIISVTNVFLAQELIVSGWLL